MTVTPLDGADAPLQGPPAGASPSAFAGSLARAFDAASGSLARADAAERAYASGAGSLQAMILERAQADVALSIASAAVSRVASGVSTLLGMAL